MTLNTPTQMDKIMTAEQFTLVVDAILAGKYSWACVLILRFAGYNPLHYIPYRTYNRLMKENPCIPKSTVNPVLPRSHQAATPSATIDDLNYLEPIEASTCRVQGGYRPEYYDCN
jgi:hypothetical protein